MAYAVNDNLVTQASRPLDLRTARLRLRSGTEEGADATFAYRRLADVAEWITELPGDVESYRRTFTDPARLAHTIIVELQGVTIGDFMLRREDAWAQAEIT